MGSERFDKGYLTLARDGRMVATNGGMVEAMALNIKNPETQRLAQELARQNGETITLAVTIAIRERLERQKSNPKAGLAKWLNELSKETAPLLKDLPSSEKIGDLLFDKETGLPL